MTTTFFQVQQVTEGHGKGNMKYSNIGGQAVMEGVMMRNGDRYAVAVRKADGEIVVESKEYHSLLPVETVKKIPIVRGVFNFVDSLVLGMSSLMFSAEFFAEESEEETRERLAQEETKAQKKADKLRSAGKAAEADKVLEAFESKKQKELEELAKASSKEQDSMQETVEGDKAGEAKDPSKEDSGSNSLLMGLTVAFSLIMSIGLFMLLPYFLSRGLRLITSSELLISISEAVLRMLIFLGYLLIISRMKEIQRTFMYHGAEHKCINCIEHGLPLTVENVRASSREHKRCGTSFLLFVMIVSVIFFMFIRVQSPFLRVFVRILLMPLIAGVSYEFIRLAGRTDNAFVNALSKPGMMLQHLTTREPDDSQIEVGMASVEAVFDWKQYLEENFGSSGTSQCCAGE